jgi:hypothetical protein
LCNAICLPRMVIVDSLSNPVIAVANV